MASDSQPRPVQAQAARSAEQSSPYLTPHRLGDVIAALQFLGQYRHYKLTVDEWNRKLNTRPRSIDDESWSRVFEDHPEFFRCNEDGRVSLVWRRAVAKSQDPAAQPNDSATAKSQRRPRPPLEPDTITKLIETAIRLHTMALDARRADEQRETERELAKRWRVQLVVSVVTPVVTAILAFVGVLLAASMKDQKPAGDRENGKSSSSAVQPLFHDVRPG